MLIGILIAAAVLLFLFIFIAIPLLKFHIVQMHINREYRSHFKSTLNFPNRN